MLNAVGLDGMSGEETDDSEDSAGREKILVSIPVDWINPALADIFHVIDDWKSVKDGETFRDARGNRPLARGTKRKRPVNSKPVTGLPRNWYNDMWYRQLHDGKRKLLDATEELSIPSLVSLRRFVLSHFPHYRSSQLHRLPIEGRREGLVKGCPINVNLHLLKI